MSIIVVNMDIKKLYENYKKINKEKIKKSMLDGGKYKLQSDIERVFITQTKVDIKNEALDNLVDYLDKFPETGFLPEELDLLKQYLSKERKKKIENKKEQALRHINIRFPQLREYIKAMYGRDFNPKKKTSATKEKISKIFQTAKNR